MKYSITQQQRIDTADFTTIQLFENIQCYKLKPFMNATLSIFENKTHLNHFGVVFLTNSRA